MIKDIATLLAALTLLSTVALFVVTRRAANAAKRNADIAAREFHLARRPSITIHWADPSMTDGVVVYLRGEIKDAADIPTTLHSVRVTRVPPGGDTPRSVERLSAPVPLRKGTLTYPLIVTFNVEPGESREVTVELRVSTVGDNWEYWTNRTTVSCYDDGPHLAVSRSFMEQVVPADSHTSKQHVREAEALSRAWRSGLHR